MISLDVPFVRQVNEASCGAAALEMVYRYLGRRTINQAKIFRKAALPEVHGSGALRIGVADMVLDAFNRNLFGCAIPFDVASETTIYNGLLPILADLATPIIACQRLSEARLLLGHYRVVVGLNDEGGVILHDPLIATPAQVVPMKVFREDWLHSGMNVTGGAGIIIRKEPHASLPSRADVMAQIAAYKASIAPR